MINKYTIPCIPPSNNKFIGRNAKYEYQKYKKQWATLIKSLCQPVPPKPLINAEIHIHYYFPDNRRRDPDNYSGKMILDGLTKAGIIVDDSFKIIRLFLSADVDKNNPRTEITVKEIDDYPY